MPTSTPSSLAGIPYFPTFPYGTGFTGGTGATTAATKTGTGSIVPNLPNNIPGGTPQVPYPTQTQPSALTGDVQNLGQIQQVAGGINQTNEAAALNQLQSFLPNYASLVGAASGNVASELAGQVPQDVVNEIMQGAAERGLTTGGGANANAAYLRALGLTSIGQEQAGLSGLGALTSMAPKAPIFDPSQLLVTPEQQQAAAVANALYKSAPIGSDAANMKAALQGISAGRGAVPGASLPSANNVQSSYGNEDPFAASNPPQLGPFGPTNPVDPNAAYGNWQAWYNSLPQNTSTGTGYNPLSDEGDYTNYTDLLSE